MSINLLMRRLLLLALLSVSFVHSLDPSLLNSAPIAKSLGQFDVDKLTPRFRATYSIDTCVSAFTKHYQSLETFDSGFASTVYRVVDYEGRRFIMKATTLRSTAGQWLVGLNALDEVRITKSLTDLNTRMFVRSIDWFQCNRRAILNAFDAKKKNRFLDRLWFRNQIDTQFLILEELQGSNAYVTIRRLYQEKALTVNFIRSLLAQMLIAADFAEEQLQFSHFDTHIKNILTVEKVDAKTCRKAEERYQRQVAEFRSDPTKEWSIHPSYLEYKIGPTSQTDPDILTYHIPRRDSCDARFILIDFGRSVITEETIKTRKRRISEAYKGDLRRQSSVKIKNRALIGPNLLARFPRLDREFMNMQQLFLTLASALPRAFYAEWKRTDMTSYRQFNAIFYQLTGLSQGRRWRRLFWRWYSRWRAGPVEVMDLGMSSSIWNSKVLRSLQFYYYQFPVTLGVFKFRGRVNYAVSYTEILRMSFFRNVYTQQPVRRGRLVLGLQPMNKGPEWQKAFKDVQTVRKLNKSVYGHHVLRYG